MVPTLIGILSMTMVLMIVGMSVARERELGTFEQLLVSPLQPIEIVIGKAVPGLIVGIAQGVIITLIVITRVRHPPDRIADRCCSPGLRVPHWP